MKLLEALELLKRIIPEPASSREILLECGFTPLHLKTFLAAHLSASYPTSHIEIKTGVYGDLAGNLERLRPSSGSVVCAVVEWSDLDNRLGIRSLGSWRSKDVADIVESACRQSERFIRLLNGLAGNVPVYVSPPTLPLPPIFTTPCVQAHHLECKLREIAASLTVSITGGVLTKVVNSQLLDELSPFTRRFDPKSEINSGFPYSLEHASMLAELIATLIRERPPKKGIITDLDDTLWDGILGEIGVDLVSWGISGSAHLHGLYQRFLESLASAGVLLAAASKNDLLLVEKTLGRRDILLSRDKLYPLEINWGPKSASVGRILSEWNIAPDDVVFIDDSPMEVAEVQASFPKMECIVFPKHDPLAVWELLKRLRDQFGKSVISSEDDIRLQSIRTAAAFRDSTHSPELSADNFLRDAAATLSFSLKADAKDSRALELINKTNQFNLNGKRFSKSEWLSFLQDSSSFLLTVTYEDKFGPLGKIAVATGKLIDSKVYMDSWVMSCRAFSRRIEYQCLKYLFDKMRVEEIVFTYEPTPRNGPIQSFFSDLVGKPAGPSLSLRKSLFDAKVPALFHRVVDVTND